MEKVKAIHPEHLFNGVNIFYTYPVFSGFVILISVYDRKPLSFVNRLKYIFAYIIHNAPSFDPYNNQL